LELLFADGVVGVIVTGPEFGLGPKGDDGIVGAGVLLIPVTIVGVAVGAVLAELAVALEEVVFSKRQPLFEQV
jgi:hypothetical protein